MPVLATISAMVCPPARRCAAYASRSGSTVTGRPTPAIGGGHGPGVRGPLEGVGAFHLAEQRQQHHRQLGHRVVRVRGVDPDRVGQVPHPDPALGEFVDEVEGVPHGAAEPVQGVHHDRVNLRVPHGLRGWWRYSRLAGRHLGVLAGCVAGSLAGLAVSGGAVWTGAGVLTATLVAGRLLTGAVRAERARRYGCW